jgi:predicted membrane protein
MKIQIADSITIQTWNKNEVFVTALVNINENKDNEAYLTSFDESEKDITVSGKFRDEYFRGRNNCCDKTDIFWQVYLPEKSSFAVETINGNITITGKTDKIKVKSISGYIDLAVPENRQADLEFKTITGTIYTDLNIVPDKKHNGVPTLIKDKMNSGGAPLILETISGDIFFRKSD